LKLNFDGTAVQFSPIGINEAVALMEAEIAKYDRLGDSIESLESSKRAIKDEIDDYREQKEEHDDSITQAKHEGWLINTKIEALKIGQKWAHKKLDRS